MTLTMEAYCPQRILMRGEDRACGQKVGLISWTDHTGKPHVACINHVGGMKRRYPPELPERTAPSGTLGLGTPWTRGAFAPADVVEVENAIPPGYRVNVLAMNPHRFVVVGLREVPGQHPDELFRTPPTNDPLRVAKAAVERLWLEVPLSYMRCAKCGHKLDSFGGCDSCAGDDAAGVA